MSINAETIIEGSYNYNQNDELYSTENFKLSRRFESQALFFEAEIHSRIVTGEFLKVKVYLELNLNMVPINMKIERSLGDHYSKETFDVNVPAQELQYEYSDGTESRIVTRHYSPKHYLSTPALCTSAAFLLSKKIDQVGRTPVTLVTGHNNWEREIAAPHEDIVYVEYNNRENIDININGQELQGQCLSLYSTDSLSTIGPISKVDLMISKHYSIPYQLIEGNLRVDINQLKKNF